MASTATYIQNGGQHYILQSSSTGSGNWVPIHPNIRQMSITASMRGSSVGAPVFGLANIQFSADGVNPLITTSANINFSTVASPAIDGYAVDAHWNFVRATYGPSSTGGLSTGSTMTVTVSPHMPGGF